ncbi:MAG: cupin, partial [Chloroflexi bacterium]|nr:cupin [Chloroflexota bacterium]
MSTSISGRELQVVKGTASPDTTTQTPGMIRMPGIDSNTAGAKKIWLGKVECVPNTMGPPHHHGEAETAAYVIKGHIRVYFGEDYKEFVEAGPGD